MKQAPKFTKGQYEIAMKALKNNIHEYKDKKDYLFLFLWYLLALSTLSVMIITIYDSFSNGMNWITGLAFSINLIAFIALILTRKYL